MDWEKIAGFFTLEAIATYIVFLGTAAFWIYRAWKAKQGRHVVCTQWGPVFSHLSLDERAREWVKVGYVGSGQLGSVKIDALSQIIIDIQNDSDTDALNDIKLEFRVPEARVLNVWWEEAPRYLCEQSRLDYSPEDNSSTEKDKAKESPWKVKVYLPQLKSFKRVGHNITSIDARA